MTTYTRCDPDHQMAPIVNINGTSRSVLVQQRLDARRAIQAAMKALQELKPNGRDYIGHPDAMKRDLAIYSARFADLDRIANHLQDEALALHYAS